MSFPERLKDLERYLGFTGWLRDYVPYYAQKAEPLQIRKTMLLRDSPSNKGKARKNYSLRTLIADPSDAELDAYSQLQEAFSKPSMLTHFSTTRRLYADVDTSKQGVGVMVYHSKSDRGNDGVSIPALPPKRQDVDPILFLSKTLSAAESRYWLLNKRSTRHTAAGCRRRGSIDKYSISSTDGRFIRKNKSNRGDSASIPDHRESRYKV